MTLYLRAQQQEVVRLTAQVSQLEEERDAFLKQFAAESEEEQEDTGAYKDGTYEGSAEGYGGQIKVAVTVDAGKLAAIDIVSADGEDAAYLAISKDIIADILEKQSAEVDIISGATLSSTGIKNAVAAAMEKMELK
ncbi:MAG: FMN-binding protein [Eubacterium sp.]|nr:FMN-binding protein [Eubacterium sp.]